jgi:hypothetical protein
MASDPSVASSRFSTHMNREHQRELSHYLRHYCGVPGHEARSTPQIVEATLNGMSIRVGNGKTYIVPFDPPLPSWSDGRARVIEMDTIAREHLGIKDVYITNFVPPQGVDIIVLAGVISYYLSFISLAFIKPGTSAWSLLDQYFPAGATGFHSLVQKIFIPVTAIHAFEAILFDRIRMAPYGVNRGTALWWKWMVCMFFEGFLAFKRVDRVVAQKRKEKESRKH